MKTSNKLLIALAASLIIVPILVIAINVKLNYLSVNKMVENNESIEKFDAITPNFILRKLDKSFDKINIVGSKETILKITLVESANSGLKISENGNDNLIAVVDANGVLQISNKNLNNKMEFLNIAVFSPIINQLAVSEVLQLEINTKTKQLEMNLKNLQSLSFHPDTKIEKLNVSGNHVQNFSQSNNYVNNLNLNLSDSDFRTSGSSYKALTIVLHGHSRVSIEGDDVNKEKYKIDSLSITDKGKSNVTLSNMLVLKAHGSFSDSTNLTMPSKNIKQLFKNQ